MRENTIGNISKNIYGQDDLFWRLAESLLDAHIESK